MPLKIVRSDEVIKVEHIICMIYGQPGVGKTSTAFTTNTLLLDCDRGAHRSAFRKDVVPVSCWEDIAEITREDLEGYDTLTVDTVGRALDFLAEFLIRGNSKLGYNGALTLQGYGQLKAVFAGWAKNLTAMGKDLILIAHDKELDRDGDTVFRPDIQGGSYGEMFKIADALGYMYRGDKSTVLDFNPTTKWEGKNSAKLPALSLPDYTQEPEFFQEILVKFKDSMNQMSEEGRMIVRMVDDFRTELAKVKDADLNSMLEKLRTLPEVAQHSAKRVLWEDAKARGIKFDTKGECFEVPTTEAAKDTAVAESA